MSAQSSATPSPATQTLTQTPTLIETPLPTQTPTPVKIPPHHIPLGNFARGYNWPPWGNWESRLDSLVGFEPRSDDVFVISFPKCGHHWSHEFLTMIINGNTNIPEGDGALNENPEGASLRMSNFSLDFLHFFHFHRFC